MRIIKKTALWVGIPLVIAISYWSAQRGVVLPIPSGREPVLTQVTDVDKNRPKVIAKTVERIFQGAYSATVSPRLKEFLATRNRSPHSLIAAYLLSGDRQYLDELKVRGLTEADAAEAFVSCQGLTGPREEMRKYISQALAKNPNCTSLALAELGLAAKLGAVPDLVSALTKFSTLPATDFGLIKQGRAIRELLLLSGVSLQEAWSSSSMLTGQANQVYANLIGGVSKSASALVTSSQGDDAFTAASAVIALTSRFASGKNVFSVTDYVASTMEAKVLEKLAPDSEYGTSGQTVGTRLSELHAAQTRMDYLNNELYPYLASCDAGTINAFLASYETSGRDSAIQWLEGIRASRGQ